MKKLIAVILAFSLVALLPLTVYADIDEPVFDDWFILCGVEGYDYDDYVFDEKTEDEIKVKAHLEPGTRYQVHSYDEESKEYLIIPADDNYNPKGRGFIDLTEAEMNKHFLDATKVVKKETGKKQDAETESVVTTKAGVILRQGPAKTFPKYLTVPFKAKLKYQYTYKYGGYQWGFTTYNGKSGWVCLDYTEAVATTPTTTKTQPTAKTQPITKEAVETIAPTDAANQTDEDETTANEFTTQAQAPNFFGNTTTVIIIACLTAVIVALSAVVILLIVKKKRV